MATPPTEAEVQQLAADWYRKLDVHAPMHEILPMLADDELEMRFPEATVYGCAGFEGWYQRVIRIFFDEVHTLKKCDVEIIGDQAKADVVVRWEASVWNQPAAQSERIVLDAYQTWILERSPEAQQPVIVTYVVDSLEYYQGSARL